MDNTAAELVAQKIIDDHINGLGDLNIPQLVAVANFITEKLVMGGTLFLCGNGGSAAETQHFTTELLGRHMLERPGIPTVSLVSDSSVITSLANDYTYKEVFSRQIKALMRPNDVLLALSTSGRSPNILEAIIAAKNLGGGTVLMCGPHPPSCPDLNLVITVPLTDIHRIQELHLLCGHILCHLIENMMFADIGIPVQR